MTKHPRFFHAQSAGDSIEYHQNTQDILRQVYCVVSLNVWNAEQHKADIKREHSLVAEQVDQPKLLMT